MILQSNLDMFMYYIFVTRYAYLMCSDIYTYAVFAFAQVVHVYLTRAKECFL